MLGTISKAKDVVIFAFALMLIICAMTSSAITATKPVHLFLNFPFSNIIFAIFTFPVIDAICELYGKPLAYFAALIGVLSQLIFVIILECSVIMPHAPEWSSQMIYAKVIAKSGLVILGTIVAMSISQFFDVYLFQFIRIRTKGKWLWLRSSVSSVIGQFIDSAIFIYIVFFDYSNKLNLLYGSFLSKMVFSILAIPLVYLLVYWARQYKSIPIRSKNIL